MSPGAVPPPGFPPNRSSPISNLALYGLHGDAPHLVLAPLSISDCAVTTEWAVGLAERLQTLAIVLSDQFLGQNRAITEPAAAGAFALHRETQMDTVGPYLRYRLTADGVSSMGIPGQDGLPLYQRWPGA